mmetsp:Transcript_48511/g.75762  ORF Transcript_48511/g.75762 Transcript_48511/m.75762 type:complete len:358 (+) Transcript_48511:62-1135(+)|eukprot:CAMPEP_0184321208 /NCGR_PEP_ID=MMETSP1049-20130417/117788_1 /TAXON_ID=77928 /ORGANISM="Proteomonas sulcata, Strain CCMP704" /LENGTH=357 /DNA_ID=CAMNT_0026641927 /DNA_START=48 /DNA_END=1121 /DNA_ORIENTATION=-
MVTTSRQTPRLNWQLKPLKSGLLLCFFVALLSIYVQDTGSPGQLQEWEFQIDHPLIDPASCGTADERIARVIKWSKKHGAYIHPNVSVASVKRGGRGLVATGQIKHWEAIFRIPQKLQLNLETVKKDPAFKSVFKDVPELQDGFSALSLYLIHEARNKTSFWRPFLCSLPSSVPLPMFWKAGDSRKKMFKSLPADQREYFTTVVSKMKDYVLRKYTILFRALRKKHSSKFQDKVYSRATWAWASSLVLSRNWGRVMRIPAKDGPPTTQVMQTMAPAADLPNHNTFGLSARFETGKSNTGATLRLDADRDYAAGDEVYISYGSKCNAEYLATYGFVPDHNSDVLCHRMETLKRKRRNG